MNKKILLSLFSIIVGVIFTFYYLNKENIYAKEEYLVYAFQVGAFNNIDNANKLQETLPSSIIVNKENLNKVYVAIYKDTDIVNKMIVYFENKGINIYLKSIKVDKNFYKELNNYEELINKSTDESIYNKVNQSILNLYLEDFNE